MAETTIHSTRPDIDIAHDIEEILIHYPPLARDRAYVKIHVHNGVVTLTGHVKTPISRAYLLDRVAQVPDVIRVDADQLYDEEAIRLAAGAVVPEGVIVNVRYGTVILNGTLPEGVTVEEVAAKVSEISGVERVLARFG